MESLNRRKFLGTVAMIGVGAFTTSQVALITGCSTNWIDVALADMPEIVSVSNTIVSLISIADPGVGPAVTAAITLAATAASAGLAILKTMINQYNQNPNASAIAKIRDVIIGIQNNFATIVTQVASITNSKLVAVIATGASLALSVLSTILSLLPGGIGLGKLSAKAPASKAKLLTPKEIKAQFNAVAVANGYESNQI